VYNDWKAFGVAKICIASRLGLWAVLLLSAGCSISSTEGDASIGVDGGPTSRDASAEPLLCGPARCQRPGGPRWTELATGPDNPVLGAEDPTEHRVWYPSADGVFWFDTVTGAWDSLPSDVTQLGPNGISPNNAVYLPGLRRLLIAQGSATDFLSVQLGTSTNAAAVWTDANYPGLPGPGGRLLVDPQSGAVLTVVRGPATTVWTLSHPAAAQPVWSEVPIEGASSPSGLNFGPDTYDVASDRLVVLERDAVFVLSHAARGEGPRRWTTRPIETRPVEQFGVALDAAGDRLFALARAPFDGSAVSLWVLEGLSAAPTWRELGVSPEGFARPDLHWDAARSRLWVFGSGAHLWGFDVAGSRWERSAAISGSPPDYPPVRPVYDQATDRLWVPFYSGLFALHNASGCGPRVWARLPAENVQISNDTYDATRRQWIWLADGTNLGVMDMPSTCSATTAHAVRVATTQGPLNPFGGLFTGPLAVDEAAHRLYEQGGYTRSEGSGPHQRVDLHGLDLDGVGWLRWQQIPHTDPRCTGASLALHLGGDRIMLVAGSRIWMLEGAAAGAPSFVLFHTFAGPGLALALRATDDTLFAFDDEGTHVLRGARTASTADNWQLVRAAGPAPKPRSYTRATCTETTNQCFLLGGRTQSDVWVLDHADGS